MKIDAVYLWLYNVAVLIGVWNKHCAFKNGCRGYSPASAARAAAMATTSGLVVVVLTQDCCYNFYLFNFCFNLSVCIPLYN